MHDLLLLPIVHANQLNWFEFAPRCVKFRLIHDHNIAGEDLQVKPVPNQSCQCAEGIVYGKLRQLDKVGNVVLANLYVTCLLLYSHFKT